MASAEQKRKRKAPSPRAGETADLETLKRQAAELSALQTVTLTTASSLDPGEVLDAALDVLMDVTKADAGVAFEWDSLGQEFRASRSRNLPNEILFEMRSFALGKGVCGKAAEESKPAVIDDLALAAGNIFPRCVEAGHRSVGVVPLTAGGRALGVIRLISKVPGRFSEKSLDFFGTVGNAVGLALANANRFKETDEQLLRRTRQLEELARISRQPLSSLEPDEVYDSIVRAAARLAGAEKSALLLADQRGATLRGVVGYGFEAAEAESLICNHASVAAERILAEGKPLNCTHLRIKGKRTRDLEVELGIRTIACFPLFEGTKVLGALVIANTPQELSDDEVKVLSEFAGQSVQAIRNTLLYGRERERAREMAAAREIALAGSAMVNPQYMFQAVCKAVRKWLQYEVVWLGVLEKDSGRIRAAAHAGAEEVLASDLHLRTDQSIVSEAVWTRSTVCVEDCRREKRCWALRGKECAVGSAIAVPIEYDGEVRGVIYAGRDRLGAFGENDVSALELAASETATVLRNSDLYSETLDLYSRLAYIHNLSREISASLDLNKVLQVACKNAVEALGMKMAWVGLISGESYRVEPVTHYGAEEGYLEGINVTYDESPTGRGPTGTAIRTMKPVIAEDLATSPAFSPWRVAAARRGYRSSCAVPMIASGEVLGALNVYSERAHAFTGQVVELLEGFANQAGIAIQNARLHDEVRESESLKDRILRSVPQALFVVDPSGDILMANEATWFLSPIGKVEKGKAYVGVLPEGHPAREIIDSWLETSQVPEPTRGWFEPPDRARQFLLCESAEVQIGGKPHLLVSVHDMTTQESLHESLEHTDRLSLAGNMAAQLAHEIANPLALISSQVQRMMESGETEPQELDRLLGNLDRVSRLVNNLSHLGRRTVLQKEPVDIGELARETVKLIQFDGRFRSLKVETFIEPELPRASLDKDKIAQVLMNLLLNAADAMPEGGTVSVSCRAVKPVVSWNGERIEGEYVLLSVHDSGQGIAPDAMKRIWEPFYTTKPVGKGTGLGLAVSVSIMDQHKGYLEAHSTPGKGSAFTMWLPVKRWPHCWEKTAECTREIHFSCPVFRHQSCHRAWSDREGLCHTREWSNPFSQKPDALIREL